MVGDRFVVASVLCCLLLAAVSASPALSARLEDDEDETAAAGTSVEASYQAGVQAHEAEDWKAVIDHLSAVINVDPKHDDAYSLLGFAHRKLGDYDRSLSLYNKALQLNPWHRGALEYLGEAYLELDQPDRAEALLDRLGDACRRSLGKDVALETDCEEWADLQAAFEAYRAGEEAE